MVLVSRAVINMIYSFSHSHPPPSPGSVLIWVPSSTSDSSCGDASRKWKTQPLLFPTWYRKCGLRNTIYCWDREYSKQMFLNFMKNVIMMSENNSFDKGYLQFTCRMPTYPRYMQYWVFPKHNLLCITQQKGYWYDPNSKVIQRG